MRRAFVLFVLAFSLAGCSSSPEASLGEVEGTVIGPDGKPMKNVLVQYFPTTAGQKLPSSTAVTDDSGKYVLKCENGKPGAVVGEHKITLVDNNLAEDDDANLGKATRTVKQNRIPVSYSSLTTTTLSETVSAGKSTHELKVKW